mmetsp:Transcript_123720/g.361279  ORF Transcript_123720/g.361279 Transcript_123720/m.361279 type:complete len:227 (+) Transcript_123720:873-1553(+)
MYSRLLRSERTMVARRLRQSSQPCGRLRSSSSGCSRASRSRPSAPSSSALPSALPGLSSSSKGLAATPSRCALSSSRQAAARRPSPPSSAPRAPSSKERRPKCSSSNVTGPLTPASAPTVLKACCKQLDGVFAKTSDRTPVVASSSQPPARPQSPRSAGQLALPGSCPSTRGRPGGGAREATSSRQRCPPVLPQAQDASARRHAGGRSLGGSLSSKLLHSPSLLGG